MHMTSRKLTDRAVSRLLMLALGLPLAALAQTTSQPAAPVEGETLVLEKFTIEGMKAFSDQAIAGETPVAFTELGKELIANELASQDIPLVLNASPSVFATTDGGAAGDARINVRGFNQRNLSILINGVPTNDIENGWLYWSNWDGLGDVTASIQIQRGLSNVTLPTPSIGGTMNVITDPAAAERGGSFKVEMGSDSFMKGTVVLNTGDTPVRSKHRLLSTVAYQLGGKRTYALEGSIFIAGAAVQWLRDGLGIIEKASETGPLAEAADPEQDVYLVPAFVGLGAPHWDAHARGALFGLTRNSGPREFARATLESVCYQTLDLVEAMRADWPDAGAGKQSVLRVDGGMVASDWTMQRLADILDLPVDRPTVLETTALGAAYLAGLDAGLLPEPERFADMWRLERRFSPAMAASERKRKVAGWRDSVRRTLSST